MVLKVNEGRAICEAFRFDLAIAFDTRLDPILRQRC
jgi:hypothetical protein